MERNDTGFDRDHKLTDSASNPAGYHGQSPNAENKLEQALQPHSLLLK